MMRRFDRRVYIPPTDNGTLEYSSFGWDFSGPKSNLPIQGVFVQIHWKTVLDDSLEVRVEVTSSYSSWESLSPRTHWGLDTINFTDVYWNWSTTTMNFLKVHIRKSTEATDDAVLVDWLGVYVEYPDVQAKTCYLSDGTKGSTYAFQIEFQNCGTIAADFDYKLQLYGENYSYYTWINETYSGSSLAAGSSVNRSGTISVIFEGTDDKEGDNWDGWFALNCGDYEIYDVYTFGVDWGRKSKTSNSTFTIIQDSIYHKVFVPAIVYNGLSSSMPTAHFDDLESNTSFRIWDTGEPGWDQSTFKGYFGQDFVVTVFESDINTSTLTSENEHSWANQNAQTVLGLSSPWVVGIGTRGGNHGFDLLISYVDNSTAADEVSASQNCIFVTCAEWPTGWSNCSRVVLHEVLHTYMHDCDMEEPHGEIEHLEYNPIRINISGNWNVNASYDLDGIVAFIMGGDGSSWYLHPDTDDRVSLWIEEYDEVT
jgi:hypothetical protein